MTPIRRHLGWKIFFSYMIIIMVGVVSLAVVAEFITPSAFDRHMATMAMMGGNSMMSSGMMSGQFGNMMSNFGITSGAEISVAEEDAIQLAQEYLDNDLPGTTADDHADTFPGYYTIHIEQDGEIIGMLSINTYTGQVFYHRWHGEFIEMSSEDHD